jgi:hypothetical protein
LIYWENIWLCSINYYKRLQVYSTKVEYTCCKFENEKLQNSGWCFSKNVCFYWFQNVLEQRSAEFNRKLNFYTTVFIKKVCRKCKAYHNWFLSISRVNNILKIFDLPTSDLDSSRNFENSRIFHKNLEGFRRFLNAPKDSRRLYNNRLSKK